MKMLRPSDIPLWAFPLLTAALVPLGACSDGAGSSSTAGSGGTSSTSAGGSTGGGGTGGDLFTSGVTGGGGATSSTTTSSTSTVDPGAPCQSATSTTPTTLWSRKAGADDVQTALGVATDAQGNVFVSGSFLGQIDVGAGALVSAGGADAWVAKLSANGVPAWSKRFGDGSNQYAQHLAADAGGNVFVTGHFRGVVDFGGGGLADVYNFFEDLFIAKLDAAGNHVWSKRYGDVGNEESQSIATDASGNVLFVGAFQKSIDFGAGKITAEDGGFNAFVAKLSPAGDPVWSKSLGDMTSEQKALGVAADKDGNVLVVGYYKGTIDLGGGALTADANKQNAFVVKYSPTGTYLWGKTWSSQEMSAVSVAADAAGDVFVLGQFKGAANFGGSDYDAGVAADVFVVKLDKSGNHLWSHAFGEKNKAEEATALALDGDKAVVLGTFTSTIDFGGGALTSQGGFDVYLAKLDAAGCQIHATSYGGAMLQQSEALAVDASGNSIFAGSFDGTVDFGTGALTATATDAYTVKTKP